MHGWLIVFSSQLNMFLFFFSLFQKSLKLIILWHIIIIVRTDIALSALSVCQRPGRHVTSEGCCKCVSVPAASWILLQVVTPHSSGRRCNLSLVPPPLWSDGSLVIRCKDIQAVQSMGGSVNKLAKVFYCLHPGVCADCKWCSDGAAGRGRLGGSSLRYIGATW